MTLTAMNEIGSKKVDDALFIYDGEIKPLDSRDSDYSERLQNYFVAVFGKGEWLRDCGDAVHCAHKFVGKYGTPEIKQHGFAVKSVVPNANVGSVVIRLTDLLSSNPRKLRITFYPLLFLQFQQSGCYTQLPLVVSSEVLIRAVATV